MLRYAVGLLLLLGAVLARQGADAAPPENADPTLHRWFQSLRQPGSGIPCCSVADCRPVDYRLASDGYEAMLNGGWVRIPDDKILRRTDNPTARAIICRSPSTGAILCFVPASDT